MGRRLRFCLAYDSGPGVGLGHVRRMQALATALEGRGEAPELLRLGEPGQPVLIESDVAVVDSYRHRADDEAIVARSRVAVDDLLRDLDVDVLVDPSPPPEPPGALPTAPVVLRGFEYALLDPALAGRPVPAVRERVERILVTTGGADREGIGAGIAGALHDLVSARVRLVVGPWSARAVPGGVEPVDAPDGLTSELEAADLVVCASGVTLLESLVLGRPTVGLVTVPGQERALAGCAKAGAAVAASGRADVAEQALGLIGDHEHRRTLSAAARVCVDGLGAARVAEVLRGL